ncbi:LOW QUALITY PROTEIN: uncharacterized protein LOC129587071 [Paramacrobiotus metropolitanus]|uniref:LOW QUALITY PROTEIN: uncharacterized protein LOC129587071 n=1 Tax=Paramacrobiotus metropolitanus TaxID=2943436 RepID=UPI0024459827|nr:LOW QUALITY PROTEIN: uncharacterized protein LOC129587071 [Paramacrobiotus metropolitanus]
MVVLTESSILARSRVQELSQCIKLNVWGCNLTDISIVENCRNLQIFSASCNEIVTLRELSACVHLQELYVRENQIADLDEVVNLKRLPKLRVLWLAGNPCCSVFANDEDKYRLWVLAHLPYLERLDNTEVRPDERKRAASIDPNHLLLMFSDADPRAPVTPAAATPQKTPANPRPASGNNGHTQTRSPPRSSGKNGLDMAGHLTPGGQGQGDGRSSATHTVPSTPSDMTISAPSSRSGVNDATPLSKRPSRLESPASTLSMSPSGVSNSRKAQVMQTPVEAPKSIVAASPPHRIDIPRIYSAVNTTAPTSPFPRSNANQMIMDDGVESDQNRSMSSTHSKLRNVNILSATLNLVKELDADSLQILQLDINNRLNDLDSRSSAD